MIFMWNMVLFISLLVQVPLSKMELPNASITICWMLLVHYCLICMSQLFPGDIVEARPPSVLISRHALVLGVFQWSSSIRGSRVNMVKDEYVDWIEEPGALKIYVTNFYARLFGNLETFIKKEVRCL